MKTAVVAAFAGCECRRRALHPFGSSAASVAELGALLFWIALVVLGLLVVLAVWGFRREAGRTESHYLQADGSRVDSASNRQVTRAISASTGVALLLLAVLLVASVSSGNDPPP